jgi:hypothetical protein
MGSDLKGLQFVEKIFNHLIDIEKMPIKLKDYLNKRS